MLVIGAATEASEIASCEHFGANRFQPAFLLSVQFLTNGGAFASAVILIVPTRRCL